MHTQRATRILAIVFVLLTMAIIHVSAEPGLGGLDGTPYFEFPTVYQVRLHAIITADDDGSFGWSVTPAQIEAAVEEANETFFSSHIRFLFDPEEDVEYRWDTILNHDMTVLVDPATLTDPKTPPPASAYDTEPHATARTELALEYRDRVVVFFRFTEKWRFSDSLGHWEVVGRGGSSSWAAAYVSMHNSPPGKNGLGHELGHYFQNRHPFVGRVMTYQDAVDRISGYIANHPVSEGLRALDADWRYVRDTPADAAGSIYADLGGHKCDPDGAIDLVVPDPNSPGSYHTYVLDPDRANFMAYYGGCPWPMHMSQDQAERARDALLNGIRQRAISPTFPHFAGPLTLEDTTSAGVAHDIHLTRTRHRQLVTTLIAGNGRVKLIAWHLDSDGNITRKGSIETYGQATRVEPINLGLGMIATALRTASGDFKLVVWQVNKAGDFARLGEFTRREQVTDLAIARIGPEYFMTSHRTASGNLKVLAWSVTTEGQLTLRAESGGGANSFLSMAPIDQGWSAATTLRNGQGNLEIIGWKLVGDKLDQIVRTDEALAGGVLNTASLGLDIDRFVSAVRTPTNRLKLILWHVDRDGGFTRLGSGTDTLNQAADLAVARLGVNLVGVAKKISGSHLLEVAMWEVAEDGSQIDLRLNTVPGLKVTEVAAEQVDFGKLAVAATDQDGRLRLMVWSIPGLVFPWQ